MPDNGEINGLFSEDSRLTVETLIEIKDAVLELKDVMNEVKEELQEIKAVLEGE